jgi:hypothetical protein
MATANSGLQITNLDFGDIKSSLKTFLSQQNTLQDYNFDGSALSVLVDLLAYNTQYNAYYLNMVANEMFLDSAIQRGSVVSHAKLLNYVPQSAVAPKATVQITVNGVTTNTLTLPKFTSFISEAIDDVNYTFLTTDASTVNVTANTATFNDVVISQGIASSFSFTYNSTTNPKQLFEIPDPFIDTSTLIVSVQDSSSNSASEIFNLSTDYINLVPTSKVYFLEEGQNGFYKIYFGDGILGKSLVNGNIVNVSYVSTSGTLSFGANSFSAMSNVGGFSNVIVSSISSATQGSEKESIDSIKFTAPKAFAAQGRAVTKEDYIYLIQNNSTNLPIDSVSVWGGEENDPPVYGQIFCAVKPAGGFTLTPTQKEKLISEVIKPISVMTVTPTIVDPDYTFIKIDAKVLYDVKKTNLTGNQVQTAVVNAIESFSSSTLNTFNSVFKLPELISNIQQANPAIITNECVIRLQKKFYPKLNSRSTYILDFGVKLQRNYFNAGLASSPDFSQVDTTATGGIRRGIFFEEVPTTTGGIATINVVNQGFGYTKTPTVTITGDGRDASAFAVVVAGRVNSIVVTNPGFNYTEAIVTITPQDGDTSGALAFASPVLEGSEGVLRTYFYLNNVKTILNPNAGTINYLTGRVTIADFAPFQVNNDLGRFTVSVVPDSTIVSSTFNKIVALDEFDPEAITVTVGVQ